MTDATQIVTCKCCIENEDDPEEMNPATADDGLCDGCREDCR